MTDGILSTVEGWTGTRAIECPWRAFFDLFVARVRAAYEFFVEGQMAVAFPDPSARLVAGVLHFHRAVNSCERTRMEEERTQREQVRNAAAPAARGHGGR